MAATARQITIEAADLDSSGGGAYAEIEVPNDYEMILREVEDYDKRDQGKTHGWIFHYGVETPTGKEVDFRIYISFSPSARWKMIEVLSAHDLDLTAGVNSIDPTSLIGDKIGGHIDFPRDKEGEPTSVYREIRQTFRLVDEPPSDLSVL